MEEIRVSVDEHSCNVDHPNGSTAYRFTDLNAAIVYAEGTNDVALLNALRGPEIDDMVLCVRNDRTEAMRARLETFGIGVIQCPPTDICLRRNIVAAGSTPRSNLW